MERRIYPESKTPMTAAELQIWREAKAAHFKASREKGRNLDDAERLSASAGERAVRRARGRTLSAKEWTLELFAAR